MRFLMFLIAFALTAIAPPAMAQAVVNPASAPVTVVFNPPLDQILRFRITLSRNAREGMPAASASWIEEARFVRSGTGIILYWQLDPASLPPLTSRIGPAVRPLVNEPIAFDLDAAGDVVRVRDWETVRPRLIKVATDMGALLSRQDGSGHADRVPAEIAARFNAMTAEDAPNLILRNFRPLLGMGVVSMRVGEVIEGMVDLPFPLFGGTIPQTSRTVLVSADPGKTATLTIRTEVDRDGMIGAVEQLVTVSGIGRDSARVAELRQMLAETEALSMVDASTFVIDLVSGIPIRVENQRRMEMGPVVRLETLRIEWLR